MPIAAQLDQLCLLVSALRRQAAEREALTESMWMLLRTITEHPAMPSSEVGRRCGVGPSRVSTVVNELEAAGLVTRERPAGSRRTVLLHATERGQHVVAAAYAEIESVVRLAFGTLDDRAMHALEAQLEVVEQVLQARLRSPGSSG